MKPRLPFDPWTIDTVYGLEPVIEPGASDGPDAIGSATVTCPWCAQRFQTAVDVSAGAFEYVEDCQVCCRPIDLAGEVDARGAFIRLTASRSD